MAKKITDDEPMEQLVRCSLGYYHFLLPVTKAVEFLQLAESMSTVDRSYLGPGKPGADADGYASANIRKAQATISMQDMGEVCKILAIQRMEADKEPE